MINNEILNILGCELNSEAMNSFFEQFSGFDLEEPSDGSLYAISLSQGIDLLFKIEGEVTICRSAFLYAEGMDEHEQCVVELPLGFSFELSREQLISIQNPERTWKIGEGEVPVGFQNPSHDRWRVGRYYVSAHYSSESTKVIYFIVSENA